MRRDAPPMHHDAPLLFSCWRGLAGPDSGPAGPKMYIMYFFAKTSSVEQNTNLSIVMRPDAP